MTIHRVNCSDFHDVFLRFVLSVLDHCKMSVLCKFCFSSKCYPFEETGLCVSLFFVIFKDHTVRNSDLAGKDFSLMVPCFLLISSDMLLSF